MTAVEQRRQAALAGRCAIEGCREPARGYIEDPSGAVEGICQGHTREAQEHGYTVHTSVNG